MNKFKTTKVGKTTSVIVGLATAAWLSVGALVTPMTAMAQTTEETIALLLAQIAQLQAQLTALQSGTTVSTGEKCNFTRSLTVGSRGDDVTCLQKYLQTTGHFTYSGGATGYFGSISRTAVAAWQAANGVSPAAGYFGSISRAKYNSLVTVVVPPVTSAPSVSSAAVSSAPVVPTTGGLTISAATQPAATLAPKSAARVPFTKITLTAGNSDVTLTGVNVERTGLANDAAFAGIVLLDEDGTQIGIAKTFNSDHKAVVGDTFTVKAGQSKTLTIAGNMAADETNYAGQIAYLTVNGVNTSATVSGNLPITGAGHTINNSLTIGTITVATGTLDPLNSVSKEVGTTGYTFSSVKITAGSAEKIRIQSIRWNQSGSAAASDLENIKTYVDGTAYNATVSSDGKYYTSSFGTGLVVDKGNSVEISIKGDIKSGSGRGIDFDLYKTTDIYITGETYAYGITPPNGTDTSGTDDSAFHQSTNPWYDGSEVTVAGGSLTVGKATTVASQNIAENVANQPLGGFTVEAKGEPISVSSIKFRISTWAGTQAAASTQDLTNVTLSDENGAVVAGPIDITATSPEVAFTDTVTFPLGVHTYTLKGKLGTDYANNDTIAASTTPSSDWTSATGQQTGNSITASPTSVITGNTMTVKAAVVTLSVSTNPVAQTVVAGAQSFTFANYILDASASGEDIRFASLPLEFNASGGNPTNITGCSLFDGSTQLNTGSNVINPTARASSTTFTFDSGLTVPKETVKTLAMKCNIAGTATTSSTYAWGYDGGSTPAATGIVSGQSATITENDSMGQIMTISGNGTLTVEADSSSPSYTIAAAGSTVTLGALKFHAANEAINLKKVALQLNTSSSSVSDFTSNGSAVVTLWDGATQVGSASFVSANATGTLTADFVIPKDGDKVLTIKTTLAAIGTSQAGTQGALIKVDYDGGDSTGTQGVGAASGATINQGSTSDTAVSGIRMFRSYPTVAKVAMPTGGTTIVSNETSKSLYRFSIKATGGDVGLYQLRVNIATSASPAGASTTITNLKVFAYTDSGFSTTVNGFNPAGQLNDTIATLVNSGTTTVLMTASTQGTGKDFLQVPAGATYYFDVKGDVTLTGSPTAASITTKLKGDEVYPPLSGSFKLAAAASTTVFGNTGNNYDNFIWSPNATTTSLTTHEDWTNAYFVPGLPSTDLDSQSLSK